MSATLVLFALLPILKMALAQSDVVVGLSGTGKSSVASLLAGKTPSIYGYGGCMAVRSNPFQKETEYPCIFTNGSTSVVDTQGIEIPTPGKFAIDTFMFNKVKEASAVFIVFRADFVYEKVLHTLEAFLLHFNFLHLTKNAFLIVTHRGNVFSKELQDMSFMLSKAFNNWYKGMVLPPLLFVNVNGINSTVAKMESLKLIKIVKTHKKRMHYTGFTFPATHTYQYDIHENKFFLISVAFTAIIGASLFLIFIYFCFKACFCKSKVQDQNQDVIPLDI